MARASTTLLLEEPYGFFGHVNPTGHAAIYLDHVCAETPTKLRHCGPDEHGVVISRYHRVDGYDWIAIPLLPYLYAVERIEDIPMEADKETAAALSDNYRRKYLRKFAPDNEDGSTPNGEWVQLVGESYIRKMFAYQLTSTVEQDDALIQRMNASKNVSHFNLLFRNCADFSRKVINRQYPGAIRRNFLADFGLTTPKQVAKSVQRYGNEHPEAGFAIYMIQQVPGSIQRSRRVDGIAESLVRSKKYVVPLAIFAPIPTAVVAGGWLVGGRMKIPKEAPMLPALQPVRHQPRLEKPAVGLDLLPAYRPGLGGAGLTGVGETSGLIPEDTVE